MAPTAGSRTAPFVTLPREERPVPRPRTVLATGAAVAAAVMLAGMLALADYPRLSPIDELQHLDSAIKASQGRWLLPVNERVGEEAMRIEACRRIDAPFEPPPCSDPDLRPEEFQEAGYNTAAGRPSAYYVVTGLAARWLSSMTGGDFLVSARVASLAAWALGAALLAAQCTRVARSALAGAGMALVLGVLPPALSQAVTVNPDSWALVLGAAVTAGVLLRRRVPAWAYGASMSALLVLAVLVKPNFVTLAVVPLLIGGHDALRTRRTSPLLISAIPTAVSLTAFLATAAIVARQAASLAPMDRYLRISPTNPWNWDAVRATLLEAVLPVSQAGAVDLLDDRVLMAAGLLAFVFCIGASLTALSSVALSRPHFGWSATGLLLLLMSPLVVYTGMYSSGYYFGFPHRYSFVVLPVLAVAWAWQSPRRSIVPALVGASLLAAVLWRLL